MSACPECVMRDQDAAADRAAIADLRAQLAAERAAREQAERERDLARECLDNAKKESAEWMQQYRDERDAAVALLGKATRFDCGDGIEIWRGAGRDWYVGREDGSGNLTVDGRWVPPGSETTIEFGGVCVGAEVHASRDEAFAALNRARRGEGGE